MKIVLSVVLLIVVFVLVQIIVGWKIKGVCQTIIRDLQTKKAYDPESAANLPYVQKKRLLHFGVRDYKPQALQQLVMQKIVCITDDGKFYLGENAQNVEL